MQPTSSYYPQGWPKGFNFSMYGAIYVIPTNASVIAGLGPVDADGNASVSFEGGRIPNGTVISKDINVSPTNVVTKVTASDASYTVKLYKTTGELTGTFTHITGVKVTYQAMTLQKGGAAALSGYFLSPLMKPADLAGESGLVLVLPK